MLAELNILDSIPLRKFSCSRFFIVPMFALCRNEPPQSYHRSQKAGGNGKYVFLDFRPFG